MTTPLLGLYVQWTNQDGALSEPHVLEKQPDALAETLLLMKAAVPEGCRAHVVGMKLGLVYTPWYTANPARDAIEVGQDTLTITKPPLNRM